MEIIYAVKPDPALLLWVYASVADAGAINPNGIKKFLANGLSAFHFLSKATQFLVMVLKVYLKDLMIVLFNAIEFLIILY